LLKVVYAFRHSPQPVDCFQAKLNYTNARENYLTKFFTIEYTVWFDFFLPGLQRLGAPIPLGGTSNHFRTDALRELGGWDPFNVTEDCDLGIRLAAMNKRVQIVDSTTWEEANSRLGNWLRQRSRWNKGYLQTHFVHTKSLRKLRLALGTYRTVLFLLTVGGNALIQLMCVVLWISFLVYTALLAGDALAGRDPWMVVAGDRAEFRWAWKMLYLDAGEHVVLSKVSVICFAGSLVMLFSNLLIIGTNVMACFRRGYKDLWPWALLSPVYWILMSLGAWRGLLQLVRRPHYWEKTQHGISKEMTPVVVEHHRAR
jgi:cellulose synthase/poly-beta-1,6-N-acetylglucosamine synthase-like glycosyltransferase